MEINNTNKIELPYSVEMLFENKYLDAMAVLCLLYAFKSIKKGMKTKEIVFYYSIVISEVNNIEDAKIDDLNSSYRYNIQNLYLTFEKNLSKIIIILSNQNYIEVIGDIGTKLQDLRIKLTNEGFVILENIENIYFTKLIEKFINVKSQVKFTKGNEKTISGVS
ncbi:hypothetical protein [Clostridium tagluense]|uniref:hypothetical protein n=1 Tax=Clostridium tagluense TaxID=360422 RepID=UPI001C6E15AC|nr:hypothetical protein [Clostridium tagluense]MBW9157676.1 hypothetical protein [Clostridium tagluense]WLC67037.1 hypothetical protein KTC93_07595 [Clostridium tagluense]